MSRVAGCAPLAGATAQLSRAGRNSGATEPRAEARIPPLTGHELRAQLREQLGRNTPATPVVMASPESCVSAAPIPALDRDTPARRWQIHFPNLDPMEVLFTPDATRAEVVSIYPGARIEPLSDPPRRSAMPTEADELRDLVALIFANASHAEQEEVFAVACADPEAALTSFRLLAREGREWTIGGADGRA